MSNIEGRNQFFVKDKKTGNIIPINVRGGKEEMIKKNRALEKKGQGHLIRHIILTDDEVKEYKESLKPVERKAGRPKKDN